MSDLRDLYQEVILDHSRRPRNFGPAESATGSARGDNPLCGDKVTVYVQVEGGTVRDVRFEGKGCAISTASASLMTESVRGKTVAEAEALFHRFHGVVTAPPDAQIDVDALGKLAALAGVREYPMRVKCASLAWHTLKAALHGKADAVSTE
jgi:nitrogen fixation protein NifU and related proteins